MRAVVVRRATFAKVQAARRLATAAPVDLKAKAAKVGPDAVFLPRDSNQARGIGQFAIDFMKGKLGKGPAESVVKKVELFHTDSVVCGLSAIALKCNAPTVLREEALSYERADGAYVFGSKKKVAVEKAIAANASAVREWDSNGTVFGYNPKFGHIAGEFGHNDFYPVVIAAAQMQGMSGSDAIRGMILLDEIRGRLAEVFSLKTYHVDHVVHGAIASAATFGAMMGATAQQIEYAIGMFVAHYIPFRAIRAGHQLSDSKGASAAISTEAAILCMLRAMRGFIGPADIFRNPEAIFRKFQPTNGDAPFDLVLSHSGEDFSLMGMHFKLGLYEHQSAGALQAVIDAVTKNPSIISNGIKSIKIRAYQPAFGIIGDPAKRDPHTRQSADHSMVFIVSRLLKKAMTLGADKIPRSTDEAWKQLILLPEDYSHQAIFDPETRKIMSTISFEHGGKEYDDKYPDGIPTSVVITDNTGKVYDSGMVMYPAGHARNTTADLNGILANKFNHLAKLGVKDVSGVLGRLGNLTAKSAKDLQDVYSFELTYGQSVDVAPGKAH